MGIYLMFRDDIIFMPGVLLEYYREEGATFAELARLDEGKQRTTKVNG